MKAPRQMWVWGREYDEGDIIDKADAVTAKVLIQIADAYNNGSHLVEEEE